MSQTPPIDLNKTLGAVYIGNIAAASLFGLTSLQAFIFFSGNTRDRRPFKRLIAFLWFLDLLHIVLMSHGVYSYLIIDFSNYAALERPVWSLLVQVITTCFSDLIVRGIFARRIWVLSGHNNRLLFAITLGSIFVCAMGLMFAIRGFIDGSFARIVLESWILYTALGSSVVVDGIVTVSLCVLLVGVRTGFKSTDSLVNTLMLYSINTGLITSLCATACFVTFAIWPHQFVFIGFYFVLSKLHVNSLLAVLNTRETLRRRNAGMTSIPQSPSSIEPLTMNFLVSSNAGHSEPESPSVAKPQPSKHPWQSRC
ncbi:hypothetical protein BDN70DRAFT_883698 [Pholiota conissans]|uniref:DUF6534 domain-containing protein n=1 Tax=Pholiota conissans TaxID=109636 RepID=A0A9P5YVG8_9AGAR|nr:hypothetical protein BDN70DRAFT_883698 [Pholiota conissans]